MCRPISFRIHGSFVQPFSFRGYVFFQRFSLFELLNRPSACRNDVRIILPPLLFGAYPGRNTLRIYGYIFHFYFRIFGHKFLRDSIERGRLHCSVPDQFPFFFGSYFKLLNAQRFVIDCIGLFRVRIGYRCGLRINASTRSGE